MCFSCATPKRSSIATACCIVSQSDDEPITTAIRGLEVSGIPETGDFTNKTISHAEHEEWLRRRRTRRRALTRSHGATEDARGYGRSISRRAKHADIGD